MTQRANHQSEQVEIVDWDVVFNEMHPRLYNYFRFRVGNDQLAQDLNSETWIKAWGSREVYQPDKGNIERWLFGIAGHVVTDYLRAKRPLAFPLQEADQLLTTPSLESQVQQQLDFKRLYKQLQELPTREQEVIALKYGAEMTNRAIAQQMGLSESHIGTLIHRINRKLRVQLEVQYE